MSNDNKAAQFALTLERIGRRALHSCEALPDDVLLWSPPFSNDNSPLLIAIDLARDIENWVLIPVGGRLPLLDQSLEARPIESFIALATCYSQWIKSVHTILDTIPNSFLDLLVEAQSLQEKVHGKRRPTVHTCLLTAVEKSACHLGRLEALCQAVSWSSFPLERTNLRHIKSIKKAPISIQGS
ncbi:hypothetical protein [Dictyobacter kobayashii]|uniref:DinB-like domain-containing protein n=1 Tax=Dictyobacter kobayashii TaxID=2014872 RepID=A0A402AW90_9CHLR|nr:hypothetical protein [Dictyobacter kobayashii]GCE23357.1 hypothetical protein KDK_71570 [Dictyobacter kobayashii]